MLSGLYLAGNALVVQSERQDAIAANLANASTAGYKRICVGVQACNSPFANELAAALGGADQYPYLSTTSHLDDSPGPLMSTGNACDLAIQGAGYFAVQGPAGEAYTRDGCFKLDADGLLVDQQGRAVLGQRGPIRIDGTEWSVGEQATVVVDGQVVDSLKIVDFPEALASKQGDGLFAVPKAAIRMVPAPVVRSGQLEGSNVRAVEEMVNMISALRAFEASQRIIQAQDQTLDRAVNEVGR